VSRRPAAGGGRWIDVAPERLERWLEGFAERHGAISVAADPDLVRVRAADGSIAECHVPFPPLTPHGCAPYGGLVAHAGAERRVGVLLLRRGGHAAGVFVGARLVTSKVGSRHVQGRTAAGGWSQQRFARRRQGQTRAAVDAAAEVAAHVLLPDSERLDAVVTGGDRSLLDEVLAEARLTPLRGLVLDRVLDVPDPRRAVLEQTPSAFRAVRIRLIEPGPRLGPAEVTRRGPSPG
jgi:hypothetical protein